MSSHRLLSLIVICAALSSAASPAKTKADDFLWTAAGGTIGTGNMVYVDLSRLKRSGKYVRAWVLYDYDEPQRHPNGKAWTSMLLLDEFDCANIETRGVQTYLYAAPFGRGEMIDTARTPDAEPTSSPPGSAGDRVLSLVCEKSRNSRSRSIK